MATSFNLKPNSFSFSLQLGPIARFSGVFFIFWACLFGFRFGENTVVSFLFPGLTAFFLLIIAMSVLTLAPRAAIMKIPISLSVVALSTWLLLSIFWSESKVGTEFELSRSIPVILGIGIVAGLLNKSDIVLTFLWLVRFLIFSTFIAALIFPESRAHFGESFDSGVYPGWHGFFIHKNTISPILVFSLITILVFDKNRISKSISVGAIVLLLFLTTSGTGLSGALFAVSFLFWFRLLRDFDSKNSILFVVASLIFGFVGVFALSASLGAITSAYGKDLTFSGRTEIWSIAWDFILEKPILGYGYGGIFFDGDGVATLSSHKFWDRLGFTAPHTHSGLLDLWIQLGLIGVILYLSVLISVLVSAWRVFHSDRDLSFWISTVVITQIFMSLSESIFLGGWLMILLFFKMIVSRENLSSINKNFLSNFSG